LDVADNLPKFKYHPDPLDTGVVKAEATTCPVCSQRRSHVYEGPFYSKATVDGICPWCIHDGSAAKKYEGEFQDSAACEPVKNPAQLDELLHRTPGYNAWQQEVWLSHCGDFCAYLGYADWNRLEPLADELSDDVDQAKEDLSLDDDELVEALDGGSLYSYLFKCLHCGAHRVAFDLD
jgi:uncharacterized protein CbrC (UPF0167 family)